jgi:hypothetical protein
MFLSCPGSAWARILRQGHAVATVPGRTWDGEAALLGVGLLTPPKTLTAGLWCSLWHGQETGHSVMFRVTLSVD